MRLEEEIHQKKFRNGRQKVMVNLLFTHNWLTHRIKAYLKRYEISLPQYNILRIIHGSHPQPLTTSVIASRMLDKASDASRIVERLHKKGLVEKKTCKDDKRLVDVVMTQEGLNLMKKLNQTNDQLDGIISNLSEKDIRILNNLLDKMRGSS